MLLAIDTSAGTSVAIVDRDRGILAERSEVDTMRHAEVIGGMIQAVLDESAVARAELSGVVAGMGPGPFTGLRVGIAAARTFALALGRPLVPIVSHDAIAFAHFAAEAAGVAGARTAPLLVVTDARRREVYWSAYSGVDELGLPVRLDGPGLAKPDALPALALDAFDAFDGAFERLDAAEISAGALGMVAELSFAAGRPFTADEPLYLRSPDVTPSNGPKRVTR
ncbi:tRNA (adenosine(37)-N6)-threonylcarbamoyltransferase complex dimerization subunit type 1 TsaB [Microterricola pindariensis]|uniref:tRNA (Adenosine(37)-N6)-threonylcarbamoyltransferase complex dimerization subunit type 1 TsaB n=1 Tax=Microterricola pindariensis TaxID=478010 RepID=A0ABX5B029_9MICO|nr:tRNA (adenosine(37)-N6)-threonylcarbamoyltransferase complex dimerization subunit type 1 TsaB [Microterricola pindariensis]PPL20001.1 tRNA (adenosine(37)-N6)-threonylcarbamoyltransferase complex dimerization subunit type 1 TsaB [Microterricola pindariensis]